MRTQESIAGLEKLVEYLGPCSNIRAIEIGAYEGHSTKVFCEAFKHVTTIDPWESGIGDITDKVDMEKILKRFKKRMKGYENLTVVRGFSHEVASKLPNGGFDFVYIDGDHSYESTKRDILIMLPKVRKGGFIAGHDYRAKFPGVKKAVKEVFNKTPKTFPDCSWVVRV